MRKFHSYGPVNEKQHFAVPRKALVEACMESLIGNPSEAGHFFTVWAPRQTGKTWLVRQAKKGIDARCADQFDVRMISVEGVALRPEDPPEAFLSRVPILFQRFLNLNPEKPAGWEELGMLFSRRWGLFQKPLILFIDEIDKLPPGVIDRLVGMFRDIYLDRDNFHLHGLALIGVRAVLGVESDRGSPFNIQRSLNVPNFTPEEVTDLFGQYERESGQAVVPAVTRSVYEATCGQPGLVGWFGELLTTTYNPGHQAPIDLQAWDDAYEAACVKEWNNTILNLIRKARGPYVHNILELFGKADLPFSIHMDWCSYLYLNGIIRESVVADPSGRKAYVCRFSSPFVQTCLFHALTLDLVGDRFPILPIEPLDGLEDVFDKPDLDLPALIARYENYLKRLRAGHIDPWKAQPRRTDLRLTEAVGHFHLYAWLKKVLEDVCVVSPEFPTGNGKVDLHIRCGDRMGIIEVKSFSSQAKIASARRQAAAYARSLSMRQVLIALFVPLEDEAVLRRLSGETVIDGVTVMVSAIGWR